MVATNNVHYHRPERSRLQDALVAAKLNTTIDQALPHLRPNHHSPEVPCPDGAALCRVAGGRPQHPSCSGAVRIRPQHRPRLHAAGRRRAGGVHGAKLSPEALLRGGRAAIRLCAAARR